MEAEVDHPPLHWTTPPPGQFYACEYPERPYVPEATWYDPRCRSCFRHAEATVKQMPEQKCGLLGFASGEQTEPLGLADLVEQARVRLGYT